MKKERYEEPEEEIEYVSRTALKRYMEELQALGKRVTDLRPDQQAQIPMGERLREAVEEMSRISSNGAKKRHLNFIGKLMRNEDEEAIRAAVDRFDSASEAHNQRFHKLERLREALVNDSQEAFNEVVSSYAECNIQHLRTLMRNAKKEREQSKPPVAYRKLFQYLRELDEQIDD
ncbi:MAG TPA: ribosome biogenesis factor YjgA [Marinobacterium sp.]|nr:ribosome biogenesis factor YjgA [Marinobacterium sp.]